MTNLEWLKTLSAEELADWFYDEWLHHLQYRWSSSRGGLIIWLNDRKTENSSEIPNNCETCKHNKLEWYSEVCDGCSKAHSNYEPKDEPQTEEPPMDEYYKDHDEFYDCDRYVITNDDGERAYDCIGCQTDCPWK